MEVQMFFNPQKTKIMTIGEIKENITIAMDRKSDEQWGDVLANTYPGHYGVEDIHFQIDSGKDMWVNVPQRTFTFKNGTLSFSARLMSSRDEDSIDKNVSRTVSGEGTFEFGAKKEMEILSLSVNEEIDLIEEHPYRY